MSAINLKIIYINCFFIIFQALCFVILFSYAGALAHDSYRQNDFLFRFAKYVFWFGEVLFNIFDISGLLNIVLSVISNLIILNVIILLYNLKTTKHKR